MAQAYFDPFLQYSSYVYLGLSVSVGLLVLIVVREVKKARKRKREEEDMVLKKEDLSRKGGTESIEDLERRYGQKG